MCCSPISVVCSPQRREYCTVDTAGPFTVVICSMLYNALNFSVHASCLADSLSSDEPKLMCLFTVIIDCNPLCGLVGRSMMITVRSSRYVGLLISFLPFSRWTCVFQITNLIGESDEMVGNVVHLASPHCSMRSLCPCWVAGRRFESFLSAEPDRPTPADPPALCRSLHFQEEHALL